MILAFNTGMRLSEMLFLRNQYLDLKKSLCIIPISSTKHRRRVTAGYKKTKTIYLGVIAKKVLAKYYNPRQEYVFPFTFRHPNAVHAYVREIRRRADVADFGFHLIRHTVATWLTEHASLAAARLLLGHADIKTTMRYSHPGIEEQARAVMTLTRRFRAVQAVTKAVTRDNMPFRLLH